MDSERWGELRKREVREARARRRAGAGGYSEESTHALLWEQTRHKWDALLTAADYPGYRDEWREFEESRALHAACPAVLRCWACGERYCEHLQDKVCSTYPVCASCDTFVRPNPYNPRCRWIVGYYAELRRGEPSSQAEEYLAFSRLVAELRLEDPDQPAPAETADPVPLEAGASPDPPKHFPADWGWDAAPADWGWGAPADIGGRWPDTPAGATWLPMDPIREAEARSMRGVAFVEPLYLRHGNGQEWFLVVVEGQGAHTTDAYRQKYPAWPGNNVVMWADSGPMLFRYSS